MIASYDVGVKIGDATSLSSAGVLFSAPATFIDTTVNYGV